MTVITNQANFISEDGREYRVKMSESNVVHVGIELIQQGWEQGSLIDNASAPKVYIVHTTIELQETEHTVSNISYNQWTMKEVKLDEDDLLVVASQVCDIQKEPSKEPYIEVVRAYWTSNRNIINQAKTNSVYYFALKERNTPNKGKEALIVDLRVRLLIEKEALRKCSPVSYFERENVVTPRRFRQWLGRRYLRQALENELVAAIQKPVVKAIRKLSPKAPLQDILNSLREVRFFLLSDSAPYDIEMLFLYDENEISSLAYEDAARLGNWMDEVLKNEGHIASYTWNRYSTREISVYDYENAYELPLNEFSLP